MISGKSVPTPINISIGNGVSFFEKFGMLIFIGRYDRTFKIPEACKTIRFRIKHGYGAMYMSPELLVVTDTEGSVFGRIATHFAILNSDIHL